MKNLILILLFCGALAWAQNAWFSPYTDADLMIRDANEIIQDFSKKVAQLDPEVRFIYQNQEYTLAHNQAIKNTTPQLVFLDSLSISIPFWEEVVPEQKAFFQELSQKQGEEVFGLFFNGFYLAHELGHSFYFFAKKSFSNAYDSEYEANKLAMMYWKFTGKEAVLERCYIWAKKMLEGLSNPIPKDKDPKVYLSQNYEQLAANPYAYGYIQFHQFVQIYEDTNLPSFASYVKNRLYYSN